MLETKEIVHYKRGSFIYEAVQRVLFFVTALRLRFCKKDKQTDGDEKQVSLFQFYFLVFTHSTVS